MSGSARDTGTTDSRSVARYVVANWATGSALGAMFASIIVASDTGGLLSLLRDSSDPLPAVALLIIGFGTSIGGLYAGAAIMTLPSDQA